MNYCPNCGSGKNNQDEEILQCLNCNQRWNPDFLWLYKSFKYFTSNLISQYNQSDDSEKIKINEQLMSSAKKRSSAFKIKDDVKSTNMLLLSTMEELIEGITMILSETIPDSFSYLHEVKLTPYLIYIKILRKKKLFDKIEKEKESPSTNVIPVKTKKFEQKQYIETYHYSKKWKR